LAAPRRARYPRPSDHSGDVVALRLEGSAGTTAANPDVTSSIDLSSRGFTPAHPRAQNIRLRPLVMPEGGPLLTQVGRVDLDVD